jgi:hypothetical protein
MKNLQSNLYLSGRILSSTLYTCRLQRCSRRDCIVRALDSGKGCPICKIPAMKRALIINVGLNNIVEHYDHLKALCDALVAQRQSLATTKAIPKEQSVLVLDTQRTPSAPSAPQTQILIGRFSSAAETKDIMAPPPPKRRSTPSIAPSPIAVNPDNVLRAMKQIQNADRIISELDKMIEAQKHIEQKIQDESDDNLLGGSIGSSFVVPSGSFSSLPPAAQPRDSLVSSTASIFHMEQQDMEKVPENRAAKNADADQGVIFIDLDATEYNGTAPTAPHHGINNDDDEDFQQTRPVTAPTKNTKKRGRSKRELSALLADQEPFVADNSVGRARTRPPTGTSASSRRRSRSNDSPRGRVQVPSRNHRSDDSEEYGDENDDDSDHYVAASFKKQRGGGGAARFEDDDADPDATQRPPFVIVGTCLSSDDMEYLEKAARALGATVCKSFDRNDITHVVTQAIGENLSKRSVKFLQGILQHCWIVNMSWVKQSSLNKSWLPEAKYEIKGDNKNSASNCLLLTSPGPMLTVFLGQTWEGRASHECMEHLLPGYSRTIELFWLGISTLRRKQKWNNC